MTDCLLNHRKEEIKHLVEQGDEGAKFMPLSIWTSTRVRTIETAQFLEKRGYKVRPRSQMSQLNPGVCDSMSDEQLREEYPDEVVKHELDPYHHRYPRSEVRHVFLSINHIG